MNILQLTSHFSPNVGGVETHMDDLVSGLSEEGYKVFVLTYRPITTKTNWRVYEARRNVEILRIPWIAGLFYKLVPYPLLEFLYLSPGLFLFTPFAVLLKKTQVIHGHGLISGLVAVFWGKVLRRRVIISTHNIYNFPKTGLYRELAKTVFGNADKVLTLSKQSKREMEELGVGSDKVDVFTYWIDLNVFKKIENAKSHVEWNGKFVVLYAGRLVEEKGILVLLESFKSWNKNIHLAIVGTGPLTERIRNLEANNENLFFLGKIDNKKLPLYYSAADIVIVPSIHEEGFGRVILESLACGTPVIGSMRGAIPEAMDNNVGRLIDVSVKSIKKTVEYLYKNKSELKKLSVNARRFARDRYSEENINLIIKSYKPQKTISDMSFGILTHIYTTGPAVKLKNLLLEKNVKNLCFIGNPFNYANDTRSYCELYENSKLVGKTYFMPFAGPELLFYLKDLIVSLGWGLIVPKIGVLICFDGFSTFIGYLLKKAGKVRHLVFYTIDYVPHRIDIKWLNGLYHLIDRVSVAKADKVWNVSRRIVLAREKNGVSKKFRKKQIEVPIGIEKITEPRKLDHQSRYRIAYVGHLRSNQGLEKLIAAMQAVKDKLPKANLLIMGGGPLEQKLREMVIALDLTKQVKFMGFVDDFSDIEKELSKCAIGVAPYEDNNKTFTRFADPTKPKDYLANGLPVVITKVPHIASLIDKERCGIAIEDNINDLSGAIVTLLSDSKKLAEYRRNAYEFAKKYSMERIFDKAFLSLASEI